MQDAELAGLKAYMADNPGAVIEDVARERKVTPRAVLEALPAGMVRIGAGEFAGAMQDIAEWGEVTLIVHTDDAIFEFTGAIPKGEVGRGYFNLMQPKGLHGHLRHERCAAIAFVERPFMGKVSAFIAFINRDGGIMFKVFVGRDEARKAILDSIQAQGDAIGVGNPDATALITAISQFIETPGQTLVIKLTPRAKAPALQLMQLLNTDPQSALAQFKIEASTGL